MMSMIFSFGSKIPWFSFDTVVTFFTLLVLVASLFFPHTFLYNFILGAAALLAGFPTLREGFKGLMRKKINIELVNSGALVASLVLGEFFSAAFIALMLSAARILDNVMHRKAHRAIEELVKMRPKKVRVERAGRLEEIDPAAVGMSDVVVVQEGEQIPVDGEVLAGEAIINEAPVTGESTPILKVKGNQVVSPSINESGMLKIRPTKIGADTTLERIIHLIEEAEESKAPAQRLADRFAGWFLFFLIALVSGVFFITRNTERAIALMVAVCADDIAVSIPLAFLASLGLAARSGIIVRGSNALERLGKVTTLLFDKTGTLTYGHPRVEKVNIYGYMPERDFWEAIGSIEKFSTHPLAGALRDEVAKRQILPADPEYFETVRGRGVRAVVSGKDYLLGNFTFLDTEGVRDIKEMKGGDETTLYVARNKEFIGTIVVTDLPREEAPLAIRELRSLGVRNISMITGDILSVAKRIAGYLDISDIRAGLLPEDKVKVVGEYKKANEIVGMIGDGINDAPALAAADVGIAMGKGGTTIAIETAELVVMHDDLTRIPDVVRLSRMTQRVVMGDFVIWGITNAVGIIAVFLGLLSPSLAALYNFLTDFLPLANSLRLFGMKTKV